MVAPNYAAMRSALAKQTGLGARRGKRSKPVDVPSPVVAEPKRVARGKPPLSSHSGNTFGNGTVSARNDAISRKISPLCSRMTSVRTRVRIAAATPCRRQPDKPRRHQMTAANFGPTVTPIL